MGTSRNARGSLGFRGGVACFLIVASCLASLSAVQGAAQSPFKEEIKTCHPDCTKFGNCNGETGQCDCPFGLTGPSCQERLFPACHSSKDEGTVPHYGTWYPKNCECIKQLRDWPGSCPDYLHYEGNSAAFLSPCFYDSVTHHNLLCFSYKGRDPAEQLSDSPPLDDPNVEWFHITGYPRVLMTPVPPAQWPKEYKTPDGGQWRPLSECPDRCNNRGWCQIQGSNYQGFHEDPKERWCNCHGYYEGKSCEIADPGHCYRNCSGVGECVGGWCHCKPGYWGHGCTRTKAYSSSVGWRPNHAEIKVYVYDLPNNVVHRREFNDQWALIDLMYNSELEFTDKLLGDWGVRTENPWEAALFYVPTFTYWFTGNVGHPYYVIQHATKWLQENSPFFNLTGGRNHIFWATNDRGVCKLQLAPPEMQHSIKLVHFGQSPRRPYAHRLKGQMDATAHLGGLLGALPQPGSRFPDFPEFNAGDILEESEICYRPEKDVVAPNYLHNDWVKPDSYNKVWVTTTEADGTRVVKRKPDAPARTTTLYFGGYTKPIMAYSQGVRQTIHKMFGPGGKYDPEGPNARKDFVIGGPAGGAAVDSMKLAKFCLAPMGAGWGIRLAEAMVSGCVPVIIQDHIYQAHWDILPFEEFSIRIGRNELHQLVDILDDVSPQQLDSLQAGIERYHRAFFWDAHWGGLAYNYTVQALKRRAVSLWSANYRRHRRRLQHEREALEQD
ncbi:hypothetical protein CHLRE_02g144100v5 [Chlamydomonas reinhardtii]|uniref:Uncharacterized protein n=1 Tax=Chlamydomonas reinhardtii TaxID=3055 RepID=A8J0T3_CHLRE|nr:uncharacterized protein CHLRE_02g144100v5 [Chlamydomonas reinhardtii]PNW87478.1 hypothetical protein CHLRE_02g144100v5 [Chlamydomonas reinhardtii]|eukprot:XP_001694987.1 exostosin-like glycosyltransferase [Chlamydomonas reinhardtii]